MDLARDYDANAKKKLFCFPCSSDHCVVHRFFRGPAWRFGPLCSFSQTLACRGSQKLLQLCILPRLQGGLIPELLSLLILPFSATECEKENNIFRQIVEDFIVIITKINNDHSNRWPRQCGRGQDQRWNQTYALREIRIGFARYLRTVRHLPFLSTLLINLCYHFYSCISV